jgi:hypothetical protein
MPELEPKCQSSSSEAQNQSQLAAIMMCGALYFCCQLKNPYNCPATWKRIIKKTVQGCKVACVEVSHDSVTVDVIQLKTELEIDLWIELVGYTGIIGCHIL